MREVTLLQDAEILIPNKAHKSFSGSNRFLKAGTTLKGVASVVDGLRRNKPFKYKLFKTNANQYIYLNNIQITPNNMETEVVLGADGRPASTVIDVAPVKSFGKIPVAGALIGAAAGFAYCRYKKHDTHKTWLYTIVGGVVGYGVARYIQTHKPTVVIPKIK